MIENAAKGKCPLEGSLNRFHAHRLDFSKVKDIKRRRNVFCTKEIEGINFTEGKKVLLWGVLARERGLSGSSRCISSWYPALNQLHERNWDILK